VIAVTGKMPTAAGSVVVVVVIVLIVVGYVRFQRDLDESV
jgi:hypothetical protein